MRKNLLTISIAILACIGIFSGCISQNEQNNNTSLDDTEGPTTPTAVRWTSGETDTTPSFNWNASTDVSGVAGYYVKIDTDEEVWVGNILTWVSISSIADGSHVFYVKAKDASTNGNNGKYGSCSFLIHTTIVKIPPVADAHGPYVWYVNQSIDFDGSKSYDVDGIIVNYTWDLGDGTLLYGKWVSHGYSHAGVYNISLTVVDNDSLVNTNTTIATIQMYPDDDGNQSNGSGEYTTEQIRFLGSWHNKANSDEHWIFYSNWTQKYTILITDNPPGEPYTAELWFDYSVNNSMFCQLAFSNYGGIPSCYGYEFSGNNLTLSLYDNGMLMVELTKD